LNGPKRIKNKKGRKKKEREKNKKEKEKQITCNFISLLALRIFLLLPFFVFV
jgi:uncharacterized membrane protein